ARRTITGSSAASPVGTRPAAAAARLVSSEGFDIRASYRSSGIVSDYLRCWPSRRPLGPESQNRPPQLLRWAVVWCPRQDSNLRPSAPEADALSTELRGQRMQCYHRSSVPPKTTPRAIANRLHAVLGLGSNSAEVPAEHRFGRLRRPSCPCVRERIPSPRVRRSSVWPSPGS